jgi:hypothetical protein
VHSGLAAKGAGVKKRLAAMTPEERSELARRAANALWAQRAAKKKGN